MSDLRRDRLVRSVMARVEHSGDAVPVPLTSDELDALRSALLAACDVIISIREGSLSPYLRERYTEEDRPGEWDHATAVQVNDDQLQAWREISGKIDRAWAEHPATVESRKHLRGEYD